MEKKTIKKCIFDKNSRDPILFKEYSELVTPNSEIHAGYQEPFQDENLGSDGYWYVSIYETRLETDEEFEKRRAENKRTAEALKSRRYETYLKLKKEFENE